jgi:hypothetical protein
LNQSGYSNRVDLLLRQFTEHQPHQGVLLKPEAAARLASGGRRHC